MHEVKDGKITMSTGVVFKTKDAPIMAYEAINRDMLRQKPQVPEVYLEEKDRKELNPNDPEYLKNVEVWTRQLTEKLMDAVIILGLEVDSVPDGFPNIEDEGWSNKLELLGIDISDRFLCWVKFFAAPTIEDMASLLLVCSRNAGVTEEDVAEAAALFRDSKKRTANRKSRS